MATEWHSSRVDGITARTRVPVTTWYDDLLDDGDAAEWHGNGTADIYPESEQAVRPQMLSLTAGLGMGIGSVDEASPLGSPPRLLGSRSGSDRSLRCRMVAAGSGKAKYLVTSSSTGMVP